MGSVFISYRRDETDGQARSLYQELVTRLGKGSVFMDVDSIAPGRDFRAVIQERLAACDVVLALIGRNWATSTDESGRRRLDDERDFVRLEIATALRRNIPVTPVLLHGAQVPPAAQLPADMADLAFRQGFELRHSTWQADVEELLSRLGLAKPPRRRRSWPVITGAAVAVAGLAAGGYHYSATAPSPAGPPPAETKLAASAQKGTGAGAGYPHQSTHSFDPAAYQLSSDREGYYSKQPFTVEHLDPARDFLVSFEITSTRAGGSTRYGVAWNYSPDDFLLFTIHSQNAEAYSIGVGRSHEHTAFSRFAEGQTSIRGEKGFDRLAMEHKLDELIFSVNGNEVWRTSSYRLTSDQFAFWVADFSEARIRSYTVWWGS